MPIKGRLTAIEKQRIVAGLTEGLMIKALAKEMTRDTRTLTTFIKNPNIKYKKIRLWIFEKFAEKVVRNPSSTSASIFARAGVALSPRQVRCNVLNEMAWNIKHVPRPPLSQIDKENRLDLAQKYMKMNFQ